jgi:hypothetical protein
MIPLASVFVVPKISAHLSDVSSSNFKLLTSLYPLSRYFLKLELNSNSHCSSKVLLTLPFNISISGATIFLPSKRPDSL